MGSSQRVISTSLFLLCMAHFACTSPAHNIKDALMEAVLNGNTTSGGGVVVLPPALSIDIVSLLRWAMTKEDSRNDDVSSRVSATSAVYPKKRLDLLKFNGKDYFFCKNQMFTWMEALSFCRMYGMDLVSVESEAEDRFITMKISEYGMNNHVWTSGNKIGRTTYFWLNGADIIYQNWAPGQPSELASENCIIYHSKYWYDWPCIPNSSHSYYTNFICEDP